jgi:hypothetical protein
VLETWRTGWHASVVHRSGGDRRLGVVCAYSVVASRTARIAVSGVCKARYGVERRFALASAWTSSSNITPVPPNMSNELRDQLVMEPDLIYLRSKRQIDLSLAEPVHQIQIPELLCASCICHWDIAPLAERSYQLLVDALT